MTSTSTGRPLVTRADMHCHSTASEHPKLGIQRTVGLPECATPPAEVYELAKARGMDFVTITDHDTIDGCMDLAGRPDVFVSEELTAWFAGEPQAVHVLCYGIGPDDHEFLQAHAADVETCAAFLHEREIACALAHPFFAVAAPLTPRHRRRLAELFPVWETRNGSRARELNMPASVYIETHGGVGIGGSDDHAGVDIGRTWTEAPVASTPEQFLRHLREGRVEARGDQGSAAKWAHSALALAARALMRTPHGVANGNGALRPADVLELAERVVSDGGERGGAATARVSDPEERGEAPIATGEAGAVMGIGPDEARALLGAWLESLGLAADERSLVSFMQAHDFSHSDLFRRARRLHERRLRDAVERVTGAAEARAMVSDTEQRGGAPIATGEAGAVKGYREAASAAFDACLPTIPYVPSLTILASEKAKLAAREGEPRRVALVVDGSGSMHGVTHTIERIREHGVRGYEVEVVGTDPRVDRRLPAVTEIEIPFYAGLVIGVPSVPELVETLADGRYDLIHVASPGPAGVGAVLTARIGRIPLCASHHTELAAYAGLRTGDGTIEAGMRMAMSLFYRQCELVLSPSPASDRSLAALGVDPERIARWGRGVDVSLYDPAKRDPDAFPGEVKLLYAGRLTKEKGAQLLIDAFERARERDPRLHLLLAGGGPEEELVRQRLAAGSGEGLDHVTFLGWLDREELARVYASSDLFLFPSRTDTYGQVIAEAQASGLPVVAVAEGGPVALVDDRRTGWLCPPEPDALAAAIAQLAASPFLRERIARDALAAVRGRTWGSSFDQLAAGWDLALASAGRRRAPSTPVGPVPAAPRPERQAA
jgi:glycosyltransferase involved in cell wall biosynthesis/predicted metal-dependent phosphoesterase TrpH